ncbi:MAG: aldehyde dehydrogenase family protein [Methyloligella sp. ZOD6]
MSHKLLIDNQWVAPASGLTFPAINPATEESFAEIARGGAADVDGAVKAARAAFDGGWKHSTGAERASLLRKIADGIEAQQDMLAAAETRDNGKPLAEAAADTGMVAGIFRMYADLAETLDVQGEEVIEVPGGKVETRVAYRPIGVAGLITPWNFPMGQFSWKVAPALAAGCTCVVKPSEATSTTALMLGEIAVAAGLPPGVLNIVTGFGAEAGQALVAHEGVDKISFTGSTETGKAIMAAAARDLKRVSLELGGKSPLIVFDDADPDVAAEWVAFGIFFNQGQVCTATSRLLVQDGIADAVLERVKGFAERIRIGDGMSEGVQMGPLVNQAQYEKVTGYIEKGLTEGAELLTGGKRPDGANAGYFVSPTVFASVTPEMTIWREEIFGPVLSAMRFASEDEAVALANDTDYGLAAAVLTVDEARAERVADRVEAGITWQNCNQNLVIQAPWGGVKQSGMGRELGRWGLENYLEPKQKTRWLGTGGPGWYAPDA